MKDRKLLVRVSCVNRDFYLFGPSPGADWHVKFHPPRWLAGRKDLPKRIVRTTGTRELAAGKRVAAQIIESFFTRGDDGKSAEALKLRGDYASVGDILKVYLRESRERPSVAKDYANAMRRLVTIAQGGDPDKFSSAGLTSDLIRKFERVRRDERMAAELRASEAANESAWQRETRLKAAAEQVKFSTRSYVTQARAVLSPAKMKFYDGLKLPDLTAFRAEKVDAPRKSRPKPLDLGAIVAMEAARPALRATDPAVYVANLMFSCWGLRDIEIFNARTHWLIDGQMHIIDRPAENFYAKGAEGAFEVSPDVVAEILSFQHLCADGFLVPGENKTQRHAAIYRRHSTWVQTWIKDHRKTSYELRRYAGSRLLDMGATIFDVRDFLRHRDVQTTQDWYAYRLGNRKLPTISLTNLSPAAAA